ncbi:MAG: PAS domain-containing protein, partial [Nocardioidaceae bacterium]
MRRWSALLRGPAGVPVVVGVLAAVLLCGLAAYAVDHTRRTVQAQGQQLVRSAADGSARALTRQAEDFTRTVEAYASDAQVVAALRSPSPAGLAALQSRLSALARGKDAPAAFASDVRGFPVAVYPPQPDLLGKDFSYRDWYQGAARTGAPYVSSAYRSVANAHPLVVGVAAPVVAGRRRVGFLTVLWQLATVRQVAESTQRDAGISVSVTDQRGQVLTDALAVDQRGQPESPTVPPATRRALRGGTTSGVVDGALLAARPVPGLGWTVTARRPLSQALEPALQLRDGVALVLALALLAVAALTSLAAVVGRRRAVEQAAADEERLRLAALFASSPVGILEGRLDGTVLAANEAMAELLGYTVAELLALPAAALAHPSSRPAIAGALERVLDGSSSSYSSERVYQAKDGSPVPALVSVVALRDDRGQVRSLVAFAVDLREQQAAAAALQASEQRFRRVFDEGLTGKLLVESDGRVLRANATLCRLLGRAEEELVGRPLTGVFAEPDDHERVWALLAAGDGELRGEMRLAGAGEDVLWGSVALVWIS